MSDLLDIESPRLRGRAKAPLAAEPARELTAADLALLEAPRAIKAPRVTRLRDSHHRLARALATGISHSAAGAQCGYSQSRISILLGDAAFRDLVEVYRKANDTEFLEYQDLATANMIRAERLVEDSLESLGESPEPVPLGELRPLLDIISDRADRFGYPRRSTTVNVNLDFAGRLEQARRRSGLTPGEAASLPLIESTPLSSDEGKGFPSSQSEPIA